MKNSVKIYAPYDGSEITEIALLSTADVDKAISTARGLADNRSKWLPRYERVEILERVVKLMETQVEELTRIAAQEGGKPYVDSKVELEVTPPGATITKRHDWLEGFIGGRGIYYITNRHFISIRGDIGGFGIGSGSELTWLLAANFIYSRWEHFSVSAGYKLFDLDVKRSGNDINILMNGIVLGALFHF